MRTLQRSFHIRKQVREGTKTRYIISIPIQSRALENKYPERGRKPVFEHLHDEFIARIRKQVPREGTKTHLVGILLC